MVYVCDPFSGFMLCGLCCVPIKIVLVLWFRFVVSVCVPLLGVSI